MRETVHYGDGWKVKNSEGKDNGVLQHKVWKPGRLQPKKTEDSGASGKKQTKVWNLGKETAKLGILN